MLSHSLWGLCLQAEITAKMAVIFLKMVDLIGIEPTTLRMRTVRSPSWAIGPYCRFLRVFATKSWFSSFPILEEFREKPLRNHWLKLAGRCATIGMRTKRSTNWATPPYWFCCSYDNAYKYNRFLTKNQEDFINFLIENSMRGCIENRFADDMINFKRVK